VPRPSYTDPEQRSNDIRALVSKARTLPHSTTLVLEAIATAERNIIAAIKGIEPVEKPKAWF